MELGDRVYAAERIMKKRVRKVSFVGLFMYTKARRLFLLRFTGWFLACFYFVFRAGLRD